MGDNPTRIDGPRSALIRLSTGRTVELRLVPSFRAMQREGLIGKRGLADFVDAFDGRLDPAMLSDELEDLLLRHLLIDPPLSGIELGRLDDREVQEIIAFAGRAYLEANTAPAAPADGEPDGDDDLVVEDEEPASLDDAEQLLSAGEALPESKAPEAG